MDILKRGLAVICSITCLVFAEVSMVSADDAVVLPVEEGIALLDRAGTMYIHMQNGGSVNVTADKTEPEGIFRYYDADLVSGTVYRMDLSRCEYLVDSGEYASKYTFVFTSADDADTVYSHDIVVSDPDFEETSGSEFHFYITSVAAETSSCQMLSSNEYVDDSNILVSEYFLLMKYRTDTEKLTGDTDGDGCITLTDASLALSYYASTSAGLESDVDKDAADADGDGKVTLTDASGILMYYAMSAASMEPSWDNIFK